MNNNLCTNTQAELESWGALNVRTQDFDKTHAGTITVIMYDRMVDGKLETNFGAVEYYEEYPQRYTLHDFDGDTFADFKDVKNAFENHIEAEAEAAYERQFAG